MIVDHGSYENGETLNARNTQERLYSWFHSR
jgi:hypothetical protein